MDKNIKIELDINSLNIVLAGLAKLPLEYSLETFMAIRKQAEAQVQEKPKGPLADKVIN